MTYEENVKRIAERMAKKRYPNTFDFALRYPESEFTTSNTSHLISLEIPHAKEEVARTKAEVELIMRQAIPWKISAIEDYLQQRGLMPTNE